MKTADAARRRQRDAAAAAAAAEEAAAADQPTDVFSSLMGVGGGMPPPSDMTSLGAAAAAGHPYEAVAAAAGGSAAPGPRTAQSIELYRRDADSAVAMHADGMARLQQLLRDAKLPRQWQRQVASATQSASWDMDTKIKVGGVSCWMMRVF
jgi:hypothetical protein